jgi:hypothetical protein
MELLHHTTRAPPHGRVGRVGIDLHLGQKPKLGGDQKYFRCFSLFGSLVFYLWFALLAIFGFYLKNPKIFCSVAISFRFCFQKSKTPKIFVVLLWFCKVCCRVQSPATPLELGIHFILFKPHK